MKRVEVKLAVPIVAPLLDVIREQAPGLREVSAGVTGLPDADDELREAWADELLAGQRGEVDALLALFGEEFFREGVVAFDGDNAEVILPRDKPMVASDGLAVLRGNLAPQGAVIKPPAAAPHLHRHTGPAVVFEDYNDMNARIDHPDLEVDEHSVLVLRNAGPLGGPGMPEWGLMSIPKKLLARGVRDMVRISDARMSGTSYGACILHVSPEAFIGGPLALVQNGDMITVDVPARRLHLEVSDAVLAQRRTQWQAPKPRYERGYGWMFSRHILQADQGCDFDFLETAFGGPVDEPAIF